MGADDGLPQLAVTSAAEWEAWLEANHDAAEGAWLKIAKKGSGIPSVTIGEALDVCLCFGWIDSRREAFDDDHYLQRYTPRRSRSNWSRINVEKVAELTAAGRMRPAGLAKVERAKVDGRWDAALTQAGVWQAARRRSVDRGRSSPSRTPGPYRSPPAAAAA